MPPPLALRDLPATARKVRQQGSTFYVIGDDRAVLRDAWCSGQATVAAT